MYPDSTDKREELSRRDMLKTSAAAGAAAVSSLNVVYSALGIGGSVTVTLGSLLEPGEPVPEILIMAWPGMPGNYQDFIAPEQVEEKSLADFAELEYREDRLKPKMPGKYYEDGRGDCEDFCFAWASIFERENIEYKIVLGALDGKGHWAIETLDGVYTVERSSDILDTVELDDWTPGLEFDKDKDLCSYTGPMYEQERNTRPVNPA